jgi:predicted HicB family RNase H-like nuclease
MGARTIHHLRAAAFYRRLVPKSTAPSRRVSTAVRLPAELHAELQRQANERDVSVNFLVTRAVDHYLRELGPADPLADQNRDEPQGVLT